MCLGEAEERVTSLGSARSLIRRLTSDHRDLQRYLSDHALCALLQIGRIADPQVRGIIEGELLYRCWLAPSSRAGRLEEVGALLSSSDSLPAKVLLPWLQSQVEKRTFVIPPDLRECPWGGYLKKRLEEWENAQGAIVFVSPPGISDPLAPAMVLPFYFEKVDHPHEVTVVGTNGLVLERLVPSLKRALAVFAKWRKAGSGAPPKVSHFKAYFPSVGRYGTAVLQGLSGGLPFLLARWALEQTSGKTTLLPFSWAASGVLTENGFLEPETQTGDILRIKADCLLRSGFQHIILAGEGRGQVPETVAVADGTILSPEFAGKFFSPVIQKARVAEFSIQDLEENRVEMENKMKYGQVTPGFCLEWLDQLIERLEERDDPRSLALKAKAHLNQAAAWCHLGHPAKAREAQKGANTGRRLLGNYEYARSLVREAVSLTDLGSYEEAMDFLEDAERLCDASLGWPNETYLQMEIAGTRTQLLVNQAMRGEAEPSAIEKPGRLAVALAKELDEGEDPGIERETPRDLCYLYSWAVCFAPEQEPRIREEFVRLTPPEHSSRAFFQRWRWMGAFRRGLVGEQWYDWKSFLGEIPDPQNSPSWVGFLCRKYRGLLLALAGENEPAAEDFCAVLKFAESFGNNPLLDFIKVTGTAAGFYALPPDSPLAEQCLKCSREILKALREAGFAHRDLPAWEECLGTDPVDKKVLQQRLLSFPY
ncbi:MAG: hypothetical protein LAT55_10280 [Opitutales bacterium]|nr:hypothetical protein [Opitutales bacterium]